MVDERPDPDALLKEIDREEPKKGRLKIFLGYAPGVGKTYAMLQEAHVLKNRGVDVVVGIVETHRRAETEALLEGLEVMARRVAEYEGIKLEDMGVDTLLARNPECVLVDELAHTNASGGRHPKRYQDVEELLGLGIDVYTTVNIQHFESQVDVVARITGIRMQETVPDTFLERADEVQVVDIPLEELNQRLAEGKVYIPEKARQAVQNYFQRGNLVALRELTLTLVARKMDSELLNYMRAKAISGPWPAGERLMVCISASPYGPQLLRRAYTIASETHADWFAVYVQPPSLKDLSNLEKGYLSDALNLAEELGGKTATLSGNDIAAEIVRFARENNISRIVIGKPLRSPLAAFLRGSPVDDLLRVKMDFDIHLVTPMEEKVAAPVAKGTSGKVNLHPRDYLITLCMVAVVTGLNFLLERVVNPASLVFVYLIVTIAAALFFGTGPSIFASVLSLLLFDFFMTEPRYSFSMLHTSDIVNVVVFLFTSLVVGQLVKTSRAQNQLLQLRLGRLALIEEMSKEFLSLPPVEQLMGGFAHKGGEAALLDLLRTTVLDDISHITIKYVARIVQVPSFVLFKGKGGRLQVWARNDPGTDLSAHDMAVAEWAFAQGEMAGAGTQTLPDTIACFIPMKTADETVGVIGLQYEFKNLLLDQRRLLGVTSNLSALAAARWVNV